MGRGGAVGADAAHTGIVSGGLDLSLRRAEPIPVVDLALPTQGVVAALRQACEYPGFFYLTGLPPEVGPAADAALAAARAFFRRPMAEKMAVANGPAVQYRVRDARGRVRPIAGSGNGYRPPGGDAYFRTDLRESFNAGREPLEPGEDPPYANVWPDEGVLPGWRRAVLAHQGQMLRVAGRLRQLIALALGVDEGYFDAPGFFDRATHQTGMVYYHPRRSDPSSGVFSIRPHVDGGIFTLLWTDGEPGLHICPTWGGVGAARRGRDGARDAWVPVPPRRGALVVNLGSELERWSNGRFKATLHCVVNERGRERFSLPFFYETNIDTRIAPLPHTVPAGAKPLFRPMSPRGAMLAGLRVREERYGESVGAGGGAAITSAL